METASLRTLSPNTRAYSIGSGDILRTELLSTTRITQCAQSIAIERTRRCEKERRVRCEKRSEKTTGQANRAWLVPALMRGAPKIANVATGSVAARSDPNMRLRIHSINSKVNALRSVVSAASAKREHSTATHSTTQHSMQVHTSPED